MMNLPDKSIRHWSRFATNGSEIAKQSSSCAIGGHFVLRNDCDIYWQDKGHFGQTGIIAKAVPTLSLVNLICDAVDARIREAMLESGGKAK